MQRRQIIQWGAASLAAPAFLAQAQSFPNKPIKLIIAFPAGGPTDKVALLEHEDALARLGEVGGVGEAVVAATDDDRVVGVGVGHVRPSSSRGCRTAVTSPLLER